MSCFICTSEKLYPFLDLGHQPPSDAFLRPRELGEKEVTYPLHMNFCEQCYLVQLNYVVDPDKLFKDYVYNTGTNNSLIKNFHELVETLIRRFHLKPGDFVIDIGSNDGTLLKNYLNHGIKILGIDPSSSALLASKDDIPTINNYFTNKLALEVRGKHGTALMVTATNVFAHVDKLDDFMSGVVSLLDDKGIFVTESGYLPDMIEGMQYDSIYHEHLRYYSLSPLVRLFGKYGLEVFDVEKIPIHGGSMRVFVCRSGQHEAKDSVKEMLEYEKANGYYEREKYVEFAKRVKQTKIDLQKIVVDIKKQGEKIVGIGAPAKGNTLLNYCGLGPELVDYLVEKSELKIGLFSPGLHIPVIEESRLFSDKVEYALMLSWNIADELIPKLREKGYMGSFIIPNPRPAVR